MDVQMLLFNKRDGEKINREDDFPDKTVQQLINQVQSTSLNFIAILFMFIALFI